MEVEAGLTGRGQDRPAAYVGIGREDGARGRLFGTLTLDCDVLTAPGSDLRIVAFTATPGSAATDRLKLLNILGTQAMAEGSTPR